jgi:hypothetical protein
MKTLLSTVIILLLFAMGWSCVQARMNNSLEGQLATAKQHQEASQSNLQTVEDKVIELQTKVENLASTLTNASVKIARLELGNARHKLELDELAQALKAKGQESDRSELQARKAAQDRAWWANYRASAARSVAARAVWQAEQDKLAVQKAQQDEIIRQNRATEQLQAEANAAAGLQARASMRAADAAMQEALNPKPGIIIQNQDPYSYVSSGAYWQTR